MAHTAKLGENSENSIYLIYAINDLEGLLLWSVHHFSAIEPMLTAPRSTMKQSPLLKFDQLSGTSVALTTRRPLMWKSLWAERSLVTTWWKPVDTPPVCQAERSEQG